MLDTLRTLGVIILVCGIVFFVSLVFELPAHWLAGWWEGKGEPRLWQKVTMVAIFLLLISIVIAVIVEVVGS